MAIVMVGGVDEAPRGGDGITSNAVLPGFIFTTRTLSGISRKLGGAPIRRDGTPEDVAATMAYLVRDDAGFTTGHSFIIDGGSLKL